MLHSGNQAKQIDDVFSKPSVVCDLQMVERYRMEARAAQQIAAPSPATTVHETATCPQHQAQALTEEKGRIEYEDTEARPCHPAEEGITEVQLPACLREEDHPASNLSPLTTASR